MKADALSWLWINFKIGALSVGSVSRIMLYEEAVVRDKKWMTDEEFNEALTLAQILPGPNLVNLAACLGFRLFPVLVTVFAVVLLVIPGAVLVVAVAKTVPLDNPQIMEFFRGLGIGSFLLMGRFLWKLWSGVSSSGKPGVPAMRRRLVGRYVLIVAFSALVLTGFPVLPLVGIGVVSCLAWEFLT